MPSDLKVVTVKLPKSDLYQIPAENRSEFIRQAVSEKLARASGQEWKPRTVLGKKLLQLSNKFRGERLSPVQIAEEIRRRRGGLA
jgi:Arc/MetJ-type ribon-helix-helix transcriptional regulator